MLRSQAVLLLLALATPVLPASAAEAFCSSGSARECKASLVRVLVVSLESSRSRVSVYATCNDFWALAFYVHAVEQVNPLGQAQ